MASTADGALNGLSGMAQRMRELVVQSMNGTLSGTDQQALDQEFQELKQQLASTIDQTKWNGIPLLSPRSVANSLVTPALIAGEGPVETHSPSSGQYKLFINGHEISVNFQQDESSANRLTKVVSAINQTTGLHGASARKNTAGDIDLFTADGSDLSAWYNSSISGLTAASFGLGALAKAQKTDITISDQSTSYPTLVQGQNYIELAGYGGSGETIGLVKGSSPATTAGTFSVVGNLVYKGDGTTATAIGRLATVKNGQNGQPLRINFSDTFENGSFEEAGVNGSIPGWTAINQRVVLNGLSQIAGWPTPTDSTTPAASHGETTSINSANYTTGISSEHSEGTSGLMLQSTGLVIDAFGVAHGPAIVSNTPATIRAGDTVSFDWRAVNGVDKYDVYAYLLNTDTGATVELLNDTGGITSWSNRSVTVPTSGNYKFVFISGTFDATGGKAAGACLYVDNIKVNSSTAPYTPSAGDLAQINALATYSDTTPFTLSTTINGTTFTSAASTSKTQAFDSLESRITTAITSGTLQNLQLTRHGDTIELLSTQAGTPFSVTQDTSTSPYLSLSHTLITANKTQRDFIDAISNATATSTGATVVHGTQASDAELEQAKVIQIQAGANQGQFITLELPDYGTPGGSLDSLLWDTNPGEYAKALAKAATPTADLVSEAGHPLIHIATAEKAQQALAILDSSLQIISQSRSLLGPTMNRLTHAGENVSNMSVRQSASRSTIMDTDYAQETTQLAKWQIIEQASAAVLAQANVTNRNVLDLLKY